MERQRSCAFTGHRENKLPWRDNESDPRCRELKDKLSDTVHALYAAGIRHFLCGMATGCDTYFAEAVLELRGEHEDVTLEAAIPCEEQSEKWTPSQRRRYARLCAECDYQTVVQQHFTPECYQRRNRYMVDRATVLLAAYDGHPGGTQSTILYAMREGLEIIELPI